MFQIQSAQKAFSRAGWLLSADGELEPALADVVAVGMKRPAIRSHIERILRAHEDAPAILGEAKDLIETACRLVLQENGRVVAGHPDFDELAYLAREALGLLPKQVAGESKVERATKEVLEGLWRVARNVNLLRNEVGTGHGRLGAPSVDGRAAGFIARAACLFVETLLAASETPGIFSVQLAQN